MKNSTNNLDLVNRHFNSYFTTASQLFKIRVGFLIASIAMFIWILVYNINNNSPQHIIRYFTHFSWLGLVIYYMIFVFLSLCLEKMQKMSDRKAYWTAVGLEALVAVTQTVVWIVVLVYWIMLSPEIPNLPSTHSKVINVVEHAIDFIMIITEIVLAKSWLNYYSFVFPLAVAWFYTFWTWIFVYVGVSFDL